MKRILFSFSVLFLCALGIKWAVAQDIWGEFDVNAVQTHESLIAHCMADFTEDGLTGVATVARIEDKNVANLNSAAAHAYVREFLVGTCAQADCTDVVVRATACATLASATDLPF